MGRMVLTKLHDKLLTGQYFQHQCLYTNFLFQHESSVNSNTSSLLPKILEVTIRNTFFSKDRKAYIKYHSIQFLDFIANQRQITFENGVFCIFFFVIKVCSCFKCINFLKCCLKFAYQNYIYIILSLFFFLQCTFLQK